MKKILVIDNYDSFTYNLVYLLRPIATIEVVKNDEVTETQILNSDKILFSPGPGIPNEAGKMSGVIKAYAGKKPMLGICLGHQAIGEVFGGSLKNLSKVYHGVATPVKVVGGAHYIFEGLPLQFSVGRYHSWVVVAENFPAELEVTATDADGAVMALRHRQFDISGVQFHPESVMTEYGERIITNWVNH